MKAGIDLATVVDLPGHVTIATTPKDDRRGEAVKRKATALPTVSFVPAPRGAC